MAPAILLVAATLFLRGLGAVGVGAFSTWLDSARVALALMFLFTASAHFTRMKDDPFHGNMAGRLHASKSRR